MHPCTEALTFSRFRATNSRTDDLNHKVGPVEQKEHLAVPRLRSLLHL